jgi:hypothetical protein
VSNVLSDEKKQQVIALGRLGWSLRRIQKAVGVRRETASSYLKETGIVVRPPGGWGWPATAKPAIQVTADPPTANPAIKAITDSAEESTPTAATPEPKPAIEVITGCEQAVAAGAPPEREAKPGRSPSASACVAHRDAIEMGLSRGRNAMAIWQDLVDTSGFAAGYQSVRRFVRKLEADSSPEARVVIATAPGEDYGESGVMVREGSPVARALAGQRVWRHRALHNVGCRK